VIESVTTLAAVAALLAVRPLAAAVETAIASGAGAGRGGRVSEDLLASAARAAAQVAAATVIGIVATFVWRQFGRGLVPAVLGGFVPATLVLLDLVPRGLRAGTSGAHRRRLEVPLLALGVVLAPVLLVERGIALLLGRRGPGTPVTALRRLGGWLAARPGRGPLDVSEAGVVARIARFTSKTASDAMVSLVDVCAVPDTASAADVVALVQERGFSRLPVFHERVDNVVGLVSSLDLLGVTDPGQPVTAVQREAFFVPESKPLPELLTALQAEGRNLAVVVDEYGGAVGLMTVEDLVEEIVGEIEDEYDAPRDLYRRVAPGVFIVSARAPVTDVNERFGWNLPQGEYETLGGLVLERLGRVPKPGDAVLAGRVEVIVSRASARAVQELRVHERR
jgi:CBS domain containing-hemolysin-like protein